MAKKLSVIHHEKKGKRKRLSVRREISVKKEVISFLFYSEEVHRFTMHFENESRLVFLQRLSSELI